MYVWHKRGHVERKYDAMSVQLLDKTRKINKLLHNTSSSKVVFNDICKVMVETLNSNILVISKKGKVLGVGKCEGVDELTELLSNSVGEFIDKLLNERFLGVLSTKENVNLITLGFEGPEISRYVAIINPIDIAGERLGTVFCYRSGEPFDIEDIIVSEYGTTVVGLEMMRSVNEESIVQKRMSGENLWAKKRSIAPEWMVIKEALESCDWNKSRAAHKLGISRGSITYQIQKHAGTAAASTG